MSKKTITIASSVAVALAIVVVVFGMNAPQQIEQQKYIPGNLPPPEPILKYLPGKTASTALEATNTAKYLVKEPTYLPLGYKVRTINVDDVNDVTIMLISKYPVTEQTTDQQFTWEDGGIYLSYSYPAPNLNETKFLSAWLAKYPGTQVNINGNDAVVHEIVTGKDIAGNIAQAPAELILFGNKTVLTMRGFLPTTELIKVASSMQ